MSSTTLPDVFSPSVSNADHLCDDCSSMGHEIRQLCEVKDYSITISKPRASVARNRSTCAFCETIASHFRLESEEDEEDFRIQKDFTMGNDGICGPLHALTIYGERGRYVGLDVFTTEGQRPFILSVIEI